MAKCLCLLLLLAILVTVQSCSTDSDCQIDQCCGYYRLDLLGLAKSCLPYSKQDEGCHGDVFSSSCDCEDGLECIHYTGIMIGLHSSKGYCAAHKDTSGPLTSIIG